MMPDKSLPKILGYGKAGLRSLGFMEDVCTRIITAGASFGRRYVVCKEAKSGTDLWTCRGRKRIARSPKSTHAEALPSQHRLHRREPVAGVRVCDILPTSEKEEHPIFLPRQH